MITTKLHQPLYIFTLVQLTVERRVEQEQLLLLLPGHRTLWCRDEPVGELVLQETKIKSKPSVAADLEKQQRSSDRRKKQEERRWRMLTTELCAPIARGRGIIPAIAAAATAAEWRIRVLGAAGGGRIEGFQCPPTLALSGFLRLSVWAVWALQLCSLISRLGVFASKRTLHIDIWIGFSIFSKMMRLESIVFLLLIQRST